MFLLAYDETGLVDSAKSDNDEASDFYSKHMHTHLQVLKYSKVLGAFTNSHCIKESLQV